MTDQTDLSLCRHVLGGEGRSLGEILPIADLQVGRSGAVIDDLAIDG
jgi:hypothetical protein